MKHCNICLGEDGVLNARVVEQMIKPRADRPSFQAFVCARCVDAGRLTKVTCRTFVSSDVSGLSRNIAS